MKLDDLTLATNLIEEYVEKKFPGDVNVWQATLPKEAEIFLAK